MAGTAVERRGRSERRVSSRDNFEGVATLRVSSAPDHAARSIRERSILVWIERFDFPFVIPRSLATVRSGRGWSGHLVSYVPGAHRDGAAWDTVRGALADVLAVFQSLEPLAGTRVPESRQWCGGEAWEETVDRITHHFDRSPRAAVLQVLRDVKESEVGSPRVLVHGDFGLHNTLWDGGSVSGMIDFDHSAFGDPAIDFAPLVGQFGSEAVAQICDAEILFRATRHRASLPLQVAAGAELIGDRDLRDHALRNFLRRFRDGTLYDPSGSKVK